MSSFLTEKKGMLPVPNNDEELLRQRIASAEHQGELVSSQTAHAIAVWLARAIGPGFRGFLVNGVVTPEFYGELARLYDQRRPEVEDWLNALVRYSLHQPTTYPAEGWKEPKPREGRR
jgi:hypothetical protein